MRIVLLLLALSASQLVLASDWIPVPVSSIQGDEILVDTASITDSALGRKAWIKYKFAKPQKVDAAVDKKAAGKEYVESLTLSRFDCDQRTVTAMQIAFRDANGKVVSTGGSTAMQANIDVPPDTVAEAIMNAVCNRVTVHSNEESPAAKLRTEEAELSSLAPLPPPRVAGSPARMTVPVNPADYYPAGSRRREEQGSPVVQVCVGPSGKLLRKPVVTDTSGFPDLDDAAIKVAKDTQYAAGTENGTALPESCIKFKIKFALKFD